MCLQPPRKKYGWKSSEKIPAEQFADESRNHDNT
jgi:hypothetical protein